MRVQARQVPCRNPSRRVPIPVCLWDSPCRASYQRHAWGAMAPSRPATSIPNPASKSGDSAVERASEERRPGKRRQLSIQLPQKRFVTRRGRPPPTKHTLRSFLEFHCFWSSKKRLPPCFSPRLEHTTRPVTMQYSSVSHAITTFHPLSPKPSPVRPCA